MVISRTLPTIERLKSLLHYDPETGIWKWISTNSNRVKPGGIAGTRYPNGYGRIRIDGVCYLSHRLAWLWMTGEEPPKIIDHIDRDPWNGRWNNLRAATVSQNAGNSRVPRHNRSGIKGVGWHSKTKKWIARIGKPARYLGLFESKADAAKAYEIAAKQHFGEFASLN